MAELVRRANNDPVLQRVPVDARTPFVARRDMAPIAGAPPGPVDRFASLVGDNASDVEAAEHPAPEPDHARAGVRPGYRAGPVRRHVEHCAG